MGISDERRANLCIAEKRAPHCSGARGVGKLRKWFKVTA